MKHSFNSDFTVQVRAQEREEEPKVAHFYQGIYSVALNTFVDLMFVPSFCREIKDWSLRLPLNVNQVHSAEEARRFTVALSDLIVTPDDSHAGSSELIPQLPSPSPDMHISLETGVIFYVTTEQFARFSQELAEIEQQTFSLYATVPVSKITHFACIKFITEKIMTSPYFSEESLRILGRHKVMLNQSQTNHTVTVNGSQIDQNTRGREGRKIKDFIHGEPKVLHSYA